MYSTVRIECKAEDGVITGTGFAFAFKDSDNMCILVIVANKLLDFKKDVIYRANKK